MKKLFFIAAAFITGFGAMAQQKPDEVVKVNTEKHSFGKIQQNVPVTYEFEFTNISNKPLVIESATAGCGCTTPEWSKAPIAPNATTKVKVGFNAATVAPFDREVYVKFAGIDEPKVLRITGQVLNPDAWNAYVKTDEYKKTQASKKTGKMK